jgi:ankyrin repeat protein
MSAADKGHIDIVLALIDANAHVNAKNKVSLQ